MSARILKVTPPSFIVGRFVHQKLCLVPGIPQARNWCRRTTGFVFPLDRALISGWQTTAPSPSGCECCKGTVWVPFKMLRERLPLLSAMTLDQLGTKMRCDECGKRPERYYPANQSDTPGFVRS
jgi:hypothetical protein